MEKVRRRERGIDSRVEVMGCLWNRKKARVALLAVVLIQHRKGERR